MKQLMVDILGEIDSQVAHCIGQLSSSVGVNWARQCVIKPLILRQGTLLFSAQCHPLKQLFV